MWWSFLLLLSPQLLLLLPGAAHFAKSRIFIYPIGQNLSVLANRHPPLFFPVSGCSAPPHPSNWKPLRSKICVPDKNCFSPQNPAGELFTFFFLPLLRLRLSRRSSSSR